MENDSIPVWYDSYLQYKLLNEEKSLDGLIRSKYLKILRQFVETMYNGLKFDIFIRKRNPNERKMEWYGMIYMELRIFDVVSAYGYNPMNFEPVYKTPHYNGYICSEYIYDDINSYIPEINKHLLISFVPIVDPFIEKYNMNFNSIPDYECWNEYFRRKVNKNNWDW
jgi:hypothetical protein